MMPTVAQLLAALPDETRDVDTSRESEIKRALASMPDQKLPTSSFARFCTLGGLSTNLTMAYLAYWIRSWYRPAESREQDLLETNLRGALQTLQAMGYLRGAVAKLGQLLTSFPDVLPNEFVETLSTLHFQAPPMHFSLIREQLLSELGDPEAVFSVFEETPIAAASIGQVHRATLTTGEQVAVKVQYPGIARTIRADLRSLKTLMTPFRLHRDWQGIEELFDELRTGLELETDYEEEARNMTRVRDCLAGDSRFVVPSVIDALSTRRVLTMEFVEGMTVGDYLKTAPDQENRDHFGHLIMVALHRIYVKRMLYSDVHPGNYLFRPDGSLGLIDFGNLRHFNDQEWEYHRFASRAKAGSEADAIAMCKRSLMMTDADAKQHPEMLALVKEMFDLYNEPQHFDGKFDYGDPTYLQRSTDILSRASKLNWLKQEPLNVFSHRLSFQLMALMFRLKSRVNVREIVHEEIGPDGILQ